MTSLLLAAGGVGLVFRPAWVAVAVAGALAFNQLLPVIVSGRF